MITTALRRFLIASAVLLPAALGIGCQTSGVGDPCIPQAIPEGGFQRNDIVIETTSVMCRTRVCLVYNFQGDPTREIFSDGTNTCDPDAGVTADGGPADPLCQPREVIRDAIYCSCRCDAPNSNVPLCSCPSGFSCHLLQEGGGAGLEGSYCVRTDLIRN